MATVFVLNEFNLWRFVVLALLGRHPYVLATNPFVLPMSRVLDRVVGWAVKSQRAALAIDLLPELRLHWEYDRRFLFREVFKKYEPWQNRYFDFDAADVMGEPYEFGYKHIISNNIYRRVIEIHMLDSLCNEFADDRFRFVGVPRETLEMCRAYFGSGSAACVRPEQIPYGLINAVLALLFSGCGIAWCLAHVRLWPHEQSVFFAADFNGDVRDFVLYGEVAEGGDVILVARNSEYFAQLCEIGDRRGYPICRATDGRLGVVQAFNTACMVVRDTYVLWRHNLAKTPQLFYQIGLMPFRRAVIRAFVTRYSPRFFWGRDDYNVEHILRRHELHRSGGKSLGVSHAIITNFCSLIPQWRYIHFDIYYTFGVPLCAPYRTTWPETMELRSAGVFGVSREKIESKLPPGDDILFTVRVAWNEPELARMLREVAKAFPHRQVLLQIKVGYLEDVTLEQIVEEWCQGIENVSYVEGDIYDLLARARYLVSDVSTLIGEAIQLGVATFFADVVREMEWSVFRSFPGLSIQTAEQLTSRLKALEAHEESYPHHEFIRRMGLAHGKTLYDIVREDVGLTITPARGAA